MSLRVYVAGAWVEQHRRARPMIAKLRDAGIQISYDWTQAEGDVCECGHHRQRHAPFAREEVDVLRSEVACAECACERFNGIGAGGDSKITDEARRKYATVDLDGVLTADVFWLLAANTQQAAGSWVELGAALGANERKRRIDELEGGCSGQIRIIASGPKNKRTIFTELADKLFATDEEALEWLLHGSY